MDPHQHLSQGRAAPPRGSAVLGVVLVAAAACVADDRGGQFRPDEASVPATAPAPAAAPTSAAAPIRPPTVGSVLGGPAEGVECLRGGTPRADVQALLGEPDSVSFGVWLYGRSEVSFGYGVVVAYDDVDGDLHLCP